MAEPNWIDLTDPNEPLRVLARYDPDGHRLQFTLTRHQVVDGHLLTSYPYHIVLLDQYRAHEGIDEASYNKSSSGIDRSPAQKAPRPPGCFLKADAP